MCSTSRSRGAAWRDWDFDQFRRRQALSLLDHMLRVEGRAAGGARGILSVFSAMTEDAIGDDVAAQNAFLGIRLRRNDPRIRKPAKKIRTWSFEEMRAFAAGAGVPLQRIRPAVEVLEKEIGVEHALASKRLYTDGAEVRFDYASKSGKREVGELTVVRTQQRRFTGSSRTT